MPPFGQATINNDVDGDGTEVVCNLRFPGQYFDAESGLHYNWHRYYEPRSGRYITLDPIGLAGGDVNFYRYVLNNPVRWIDPWGLRFAEAWGAGGAAIGGSVVAGGSIVVDAATGGLNILATPAEIALGMAIGGTVGYELGSAADWIYEMAKGGKQNIDNEYVRDVKNQGTQDPCTYLRKLYSDTCDKQERRKIKQAMKRFNCDGKNRFK